MPTPIDEHGGWIAAVLTFLTGGVAVWFKGWLRMRSELRTDSSAAQAHTVSSEMMEQMRREILRLSILVNELSTKLGVETRARLRAEERVALLESEIRIMKSHGMHDFKETGDD